MEELEGFVIRAKAAAYAGGRLRDRRSSRTASHDLSYVEGSWRYLDSYFGGTDFLGQEIVWRKEQPVWGMNYSGAILRDDLITGAVAGAIIIEALSSLYRQNRFLGGYDHQQGDWSYRDRSEGTVARFIGQETIETGSTLVYRLHYHGGVIRS